MPGQSSTVSVLASGSSTEATFQISDEDHTLANPVKFMLTKK